MSYFVPSFLQVVYEHIDWIRYAVKRRVLHFSYYSALIQASAFLGKLLEILHEFQCDAFQADSEH